MAYTEVTLVVEGAVDQEWQVGPDGSLQDLVNNLDKEQAKEGWTGQLYVLHHEHEPPPADLGPVDDLDALGCECAQYAQDHRPYRVWGPAQTVTPETGP